MVIVSCEIDGALVGRLVQQFALLAFRSLSRIFDNERGSGMAPFKIGLPTSCRSTSDAGGPLHHPINDKTLCLIVWSNLDVPTALGCDDGWVKSNLLLIYPKKPSTADTNRRSS